MFSLARQYQRTDGTGLFRCFILRRILRIYPLSVTAVLASWLLAVMHVTPGPPLEPRELLSNLALVQNLTDTRSSPGPLWSLPFEMQMYVAFPALYLLTRRRIGPWFWAWAGSTGALLVMASLDVKIDAVKFVPCFLPGIMAYVGRHGRPTLPSASLPGALAAFAIFYSALVKRGAPELLLAPSFCLALGLFLPRVKQLSAGRVARAAKVVATYSYGMYLGHHELLSLVSEYGATWPLLARILVFLVALASVAVVSYHAIERPFILLGAALERGWTAARAQAVSPGGSMRGG